MKKIKLLMMTLLITVLAVGCSKGSEQGGETGETSPKQIITKIQETLSKAYDMPLEDGVLSGYFLTDMTNEEEMLMYEGIFNSEDIKSGYILQPMMNVKSELIIVAEMLKMLSQLKILRLHMKKFYQIKMQCGLVIYQINMS